jgi:hypothetical protein
LLLGIALASYGDVLRCFQLRYELAQLGEFRPGIAEVRTRFF